MNEQSPENKRAHRKYIERVVREKEADDEIREFGEQLELFPENHEDRKAER